ncbi:MAG TPA: hypothetical protein VMT89_10400, partial [Candidatus Acidoferrales bacterium]|nr:hypothetical protein [Candidatus Acidoferrales bacterium]
MEVFFRIAFYIVTGLALAGASVWYVQSMYRTIAGRDGIVIAPIVIAGDNDQHSRGLVLAHMLNARLREIESDLRSSQKELLPDAGNMPAAAKPPGAKKAPAAPMSGPRLLKDELLTQPVELQARLLETTKIDVAVGGVQVGGVVDWVQRQMAPNPLVLTLYEDKGVAEI